MVRWKEIKLSEKEEVNFAQFWAALPVQSRVAKVYCRTCWAKKKIEASDMEKIIHAIERLKASKRWQDGFAPNASTIINQERWDDEAGLPDAKPATALPVCKTCGFNATLHDLRKLWSAERWKKDRLPEEVCGEYQ